MTYRRAALLAGLAFLLSCSAYCMTPAGQAWLQGVQEALGAGLARDPRPLRLAQPEGLQAARLFWLAEDGLWSVEQMDSVPENPLELRAEQLSNALLERLELDLLVVRAMVGQDAVLHLFFSTSQWQPDAWQEVQLTQSLVRTLLSDFPWLTGVRLLLPQHHLDLSRPLSYFQRDSDPWLPELPSTRGPWSRSKATLQP